MLTIWTKNLKTNEERENFHNQVLSAKPVLDRLNQLLKEKEESLERSERSLTAYETPNWAYTQAHKNGYYSALQYLKDTLNLDQQKENNGLTKTYRPERPSSNR